MKYFTTITSKGQITIPAHIRQQWQVKPGQKIMVETGPQGQAIIQPSIDQQELDRLTQAHLHAQGFTPEQLQQMADSYQNGQGYQAYIEDKYNHDQ